FTMYKGGSGSFTVQLAKAPSGSVNVQVNRTEGSSNISVSGGASLAFGASNWSTPQTVTVSAAQVPDFQDSKATLTLTSSNSSPSIVRVLAVDNTVDEEFVGPFASWKDLKRDFGAKGDGTNDDTVALQNALNTLQPNSTNHVVYLPEGNYRI